MRKSASYVMLQIAKAKAMRANCNKRQVGCVLVDVQGHVASTGYNGRASKLPNCTKGGICKNRCEGVHAEINALIQAKNPEYVHTCYTTIMPCWHCFKALMNTRCDTIITLRTAIDEEQRDGALLWLDSLFNDIFWLNEEEDELEPVDKHAVLKCYESSV